LNRVYDIFERLPDGTDLWKGYVHGLEQRDKWNTRKQSRFDLKDFSVTIDRRSPILLRAEHPAVIWLEIRLDSQGTAVLENPILFTS
jgi:hypothetical protein